MLTVGAWPVTSRPNNNTPPGKSDGPLVAYVVLRLATTIHLKEAAVIGRRTSLIQLPGFM